jgi:DNA-binding response OmpR family regulator
MLDDPELARNVGLVITDHLMPKMNGPEFVSKLRGKFSELPIIVLSGMPDAEREYVGLNIAYQLKPIAPEELIRLVNSFSRDALDRIA